MRRWSWASYQPPMVADVGGELHVIDGQHQSIAAATLQSLGTPGFDEIPVMVVDATTAAQRAQAFVGRNRDRLQITPTQVYFAAVAAGDEDALTVAQVCERAGVRVLRLPPSGTANKRWKPGDTMAITTIQRLIQRRHALGARKVLEAIVQAGFAPVASSQIKAVETLLAVPVDGISAKTVTATLKAMGAADLERDARIYAGEHGLTVAKAMVTVIRNKSISLWDD